MLYLDMLSQKILFAILFCLFLISISVRVLGQEYPLAFKSYLVKDGLSSNTVNCTLKDRFGLLWIGTDDGLNRFDGTNFKVYRWSHMLSERKLIRSSINALYENSAGDLWIGTNGDGLYIYNRSSESIDNFKFQGKKYITSVKSIEEDVFNKLWIGCYRGLFIADPNSKKLIAEKKYVDIMRFFENRNVLYVYKDRKHKMWIGTDHGIFVYNQDLKLTHHYQHADSNSNSLAHNYVMVIQEDGLGRLWVGTKGGLSLLISEQEINFKNFKNLPSGQTISSNRIYTLSPDGKNHLWIGTNKGLDIMNMATYKVKSFKPDERNPNSLTSRSISSILIDKSGIVWLGTYQGGLNKYDENLSLFNLKEFNNFDPYGLRSPMVTSFAEYANKVFVGTDGGGLHLFDPSTNLLTHIALSGTRNVNQDVSIMTMEMGSDKRLWIGTYADGIFVYDPKTKSSRQYIKGIGDSFLSDQDIYCIKQDRKGNIWVGTNEGGVNVIHAKTGRVSKFMNYKNSPANQKEVSSNCIRSIEEDRNGNIWIGTFGAGISVFNPQTRLFTFYNRERGNIPSNYILSIKEDKIGNIWVGTSGNGLAYLKSGTKKFITFSDQNGLSNGMVYKILIDSLGKFWFSTSNGLNCYDPIKRSFKDYTYHSGLQNGSFILGSGICLSSGEVYFGGQKGFNHFNPAQFRVNKNIPSIIFTDLIIDNQSVAPSDDGAIQESLLLAKNIKIRYKQNFSIAFEAINFTVPEENVYEYRLEGFDHKWIRAAKEHKAYYTNLDPGKYTFRVRAGNNDGIWNKQGKSIRIIVVPPFYRTIYAYISYMLLFIAAIWFMRHRGIKQLKNKFALEQERIRAKQLLEEERQRASHLHHLDQLKIKFLTNLSHEFRTPISLIMGPVDTLLKQNQRSEQSVQLSLVKRNARRLLNLVNQLLDFRKMEENELKLKYSVADLILYMHEVSESFADMAVRKSIDYSFHSIIPSLVVSFDQEKVERILFNLLGNAFKFTLEGGSISLQVDEVCDDEHDNFVRVYISVRDTGIGIPKEAQTQIFESFFQYESDEKILNQGTGIGLSIVQAFVRMHDGEIHVNSDLDQGSVFSFYLRLQRATYSSHKQRITELVEPEFTSFGDNNESSVMTDRKAQISILIIDDDDDFRFYLKDNFKIQYQVVEASNGKEGWQKALFHLPHLIVCDVNMPVTDGLTLVHKLKADKRTRHIPVILLTAANTPSAELAGLKSGASDYITKPFDFNLLQTKIDNLLLLNQSMKDTYSRQLNIIVPETELHTVQEKFLKKVVAFIHDNLHNNQLSVEMLSTYLLISRASLYNKLMEYTGMSPVDFIRSVRLEKAYYLLYKSDMTIAEIAYEVGFSSPNYFTKVFKTKYHITPSELIQSRFH